MKKLMIVSLAALSFVACGKGHRNPFKAAKNATEDLRLSTNSWEDEKCRSTSDAGIIQSAVNGVTQGSLASAKSYRTQFKFTGSDATREEIYYIGSNCEGEAYTIREKGPLELTGKKSTNSGKDINIDFNKVTVKINSEDGAKVANAIGLCGKSDWANGAKEEVSPERAAKKNCNGTGPRHISTIYDYTNDGKLKFGDSSKVAIAAENRSNSLEGATYRKKN